MVMTYNHTTVDSNTNGMCSGAPGRAVFSRSHAFVCARLLYGSAMAKNVLLAVSLTLALPALLVKSEGEEV